MQFLEKVWEVIKKVLLWICDLIKAVFAKDAVINFLFRLLEVIFAGFLGLIVFLIVNIWFTKLVAIVVVAIVFYFFSPIIKPYIDKARKWIIAKITRIDCE